MIKHPDVLSTNFVPKSDLIMVKPRELPKGELKQDGLIVEIEQNESIVDRPTYGKIVALGKDITEYKVNDILIWEERAGQDLILGDGKFLLIGKEAVLGTVLKKS